MAAKVINESAAVDAQERSWVRSIRRLVDLPSLAIFAAIGLFLILDLKLPRGATAAIGYALVPVLAATKRNIAFVVALTFACTALTWIGFLFEPPGVPWWFSAFDRSMVSMVLWLICLLVSRRLALMASLDLALADLTRSNQELDRFASVAAHDLRGPLSAISLL